MLFSPTPKVAEAVRGFESGLRKVAFSAQIPFTGDGEPAMENRPVSANSAELASSHGAMSKAVSSALRAA